MPTVSRWFIRTGLLGLGLGFTIGALILFNKGWPLHPGLWRWLPAHIELALIGWTLNLALGVGYWSFPRFLHGAARGASGPIWMAYVLLNSGVVVGALGPLLSAPGWLLTVGRFAQLAAAALAAASIWPRIKPHGQ
jgi:hypothetical protein